MSRTLRLSPLVHGLCCALLFLSCESFYGTLGGADKTDTFDTPETIAERIDRWRNTWLAHYGLRITAGFTIGKWYEIETAIERQKLQLWINNGFDPRHPRFLNENGDAVNAIALDPESPDRCVEGTICDEDYFVFYDDTWFSQNVANATGSVLGQSWIGVVRAVNIFDQDPKRGSVIVEYLEGCFPDRPPFKAGPQALSFYGIYFRVITDDTIVFANPIDLAARINGKPYHTERSTLGDAIALNNVENDIEFVDWGEELPFDREGCRQ
jgi:hypothetical protein